MADQWDSGESWLISAHWEPSEVLNKQSQSGVVGQQQPPARWQHHHEQHHSSSVVEQPRTAQQQSTIRQQWILLKCDLKLVAVLE